MQFSVSLFFNPVMVSIHKNLYTYTHLSCCVYSLSHPTTNRSFIQVILTWLSLFISLLTHNVSFLSQPGIPFILLVIRSTKNEGGRESRSVNTVATHHIVHPAGSLVITLTSQLVLMEHVKNPNCEPC